MTTNTATNTKQQISEDFVGQLFVVSAPSGAGKSSLVKALMELDAGVQHSISHTTRAPRGREVDGREYHFIDDPSFERMVANEEFLEWAEVHGNRYGTSRQEVLDCLRAGHDVMLEIDCQGALQVQNIFPQALLIFILPPSWEALRKRLSRRGEDSPETIETRLNNAHYELQQLNHFDFVIINDSFERAVFDLKAIVHTQRLRFAAQSIAHSDIFSALCIDS